MSGLGKMVTNAYVATDCRGGIGHGKIADRGHRAELHIEFRVRGVMKICSVKDELELSGDTVIVRRRGVGNALAAGLNGDRSIAISTITAIQLKLGGWTPGYILFSYAGSKPFRGGLLEATQDPDAFIFEKALNEQVTRFKQKVDELRRSPAKAATSGSSLTLADELMKLAKMKEAGALSDSEFAAAKAKLLS